MYISKKTAFFVPPGFLKYLAECLAGWYNPLFVADRLYKLAHQLIAQGVATRLHYSSKQYNSTVVVRLTWS